MCILTSCVILYFDMASFETEKRDYEKQVYAWIKAAADRDAKGLTTLGSVFMGTDGSSSARSASEADVVALLTTAGFPLDVKLTYYSKTMVKQTTKPYIAHNVTVEGRTYKKIALMNGKGDASGVAYNVTLRWRKDVTPVYKWTTNKRGVSVLQGTRPIGRGAGYHYKYWYVPASTKSSLLDKCRKWADAIWEAYSSKGISGANIVVTDFQNDPLVIYRKNRAAMQRLKLARNTRAEYSSAGSATPQTLHSTTSEEMDAETNRKRTREDANSPGYVHTPLMPSPPSAIATYTSDSPIAPGYSPISVAPDYSPIHEVFVVPDTPSIPPMTEPHIDARDSIDDTIDYINDHPSILAEVPTLESHDALMHDPRNAELDDAMQAYEQQPSYEGLQRIIHIDPNGPVSKLKFTEMIHMAAMNGVPVQNLDDMCRLYFEMGRNGDTFPQYIEE